MQHADYIIIDDDYVIDTSSCDHKYILSLIREDNQTMNPINCSIIVDDNRVFLVAITNIMPGSELVYTIRNYQSHPFEM